MSNIKFKFDPHQPHQLAAIDAVTECFEGFPKKYSEDVLSEEIVGNLPPYQNFSHKWLRENVADVQKKNEIPIQGMFNELDLDDGAMLDGISNEFHECAHFTIEMETGTGKTYAYIRTMYELFTRYGFRKFIIVVPSIAIFEGVQKTFEDTRSHFLRLYDGNYVAPLAYDSSQMSRLRDYATSTLPTCLVMTIASFRSKRNRIFKPTEKLPGDRLPYQYIQETSPIIILDEPQNMESDRSQEAIRTLAPLFVLRYSATHRTTPNMLYRLTPFEAFQQGLVKRIEVDAVTERDSISDAFFDLKQISTDLRATLTTRVMRDGKTRRQDITIKQGDDLYKKSGRDEHRGYVVEEINRGEGYIEFTNGERFHLDDDSGINLSTETVFRAQIRATIERHMQRQHKLASRGIKVLSLFFIDTVANYVNDDGIIKRIFDEEFERLKKRFPQFKEKLPHEVRDGYFAINRNKKTGEDTFIQTRDIDELSKRKAEREAEKLAFELIMRRKEQLLSLDEDVSFIFAHSALKEGWDNPNVFQICTLNQSKSEIKKRQEIGRGLRLCVDQSGTRIFEEDVNVLTVVANESYENYVSSLQSEYDEFSEKERPPAPTRARRAIAHRNDVHFRSKAFSDFWDKLSQRTQYKIHIDTAGLIQECVERLNNTTYPEPMVVVESGHFVMNEVRLTLKSINPIDVKVLVETQNTHGDESVETITLSRNPKHKRAMRDIGKKTGIEYLEGYCLMEVKPDYTVPYVDLENGVRLHQGTPYSLSYQSGDGNIRRAISKPQERYAIFDLIGRASRETDLTRPTLNSIFDGLINSVKEKIFENPEGFANVFINTIRDQLARHIVDNLTFELLPDADGYDLEEIFPEQVDHVQRELLDAGSNGLYDKVQKDSEVEERFVENSLKDDAQVLFYFKFPPRFKINLPNIIGNYNPDWGIVYEDGEKRQYIELVRETKGTENINKLQFANEGRKIKAAQKHFDIIGVDYRHITDKTPSWWKSSSQVNPLDWE